MQVHANGNTQTVKQSRLCTSSQHTNTQTHKEVIVLHKFANTNFRLLSIGITKWAIINVLYHNAIQLPVNFATMCGDVRAGSQMLSGTIYVASGVSWPEKREKPASICSDGGPPEDMFIHI